MLSATMGLFPAKVMAYVPFVGTMFIAATDTAVGPLKFVQYGALGICGLAVVGLFAYLNKLTDLHKSERQELVAALKLEGDKREKIAKDAIQAMDRLADCLADRPCVSKDKRSKIGVG